MPPQLKNDLYWQGEIHLYVGYLLAIDDTLINQWIFIYYSVYI